MKTIPSVGIAAILFGMGSMVAQAEQIDARLDWSRRVTLSAPVNGVVLSVHTSGGDRVAKDTVLLRLDPREFDTAVKQAAAEVTSRQELRAEAEREAQRAEELYERTVLSDHELQLARIQFKTAEANLEAARAALAKAKLEKERSEVRAPFDAIVLNRAAEVGQTIVSSLRPEALFALAEQGYMLARADVGFAKLARLKLGDPGQITVGAKQYAGTLVEIGLEPVKPGGSEPTYAVVYRFTTNETVLRKGQPAKLEIP